jgi:Fur family ferric uptake transcriptional regulator
MTAQRRAVAEVMRGEHVHMTAEEILTKARSNLPEISLATVYNALNELVEMGEVVEVRATEGPVRYDPNTVSPHHHLVCNSCESLFDVWPSGSEELRLPDSERHGFVIEEVDITFRGVCPNCAKAPALV